MSCRGTRTQPEGKGKWRCRKGRISCGFMSYAAAECRASVLSKEEKLKSTYFLTTTSGTPKTGAKQKLAPFLERVPFIFFSCVWVRTQHLLSLNIFLVFAIYIQTAASVLALKAWNQKSDGNRALVPSWHPHGLLESPALFPTSPGQGCKEVLSISPVLVEVRDLSVHMCHSKMFLSG